MTFADDVYNLAGNEVRDAKYRLINQAEEKSVTIFEMCGQQGKTRNAARSRRGAMSQKGGREVMNKTLGGAAAVVGVAALFAGGVALGQATRPAVEAVPVPTVTATVKVAPAPITKYEYVETVKEVTPQVCIDALNKSAGLMALIEELPKLASNAIGAAYERDAAALEANSSEVEALKAQVQAAQTPLAADVLACRQKK